MILSTLLSLAVLASAAPRSQPAAPAKRAAVKPAPAPQAPAPEEVLLSDAPQPAVQTGERLVAFGVEVSHDGGDLRVDHVLPGSEAATLGLAAGDVLLNVGGVDAKDAASVAQVLADFKPETRMWAIVRRNGAISTLETELPRIRVASARGPDALSSLEEELARQHLEAAKGREAQALKNLVTPRLEIGSGQRTWLQFAAGVPAEAKAGDVLEAIIATGLAADANLDYLAIPPRSRAWVEVAEATSKDDVRSVRLHVFKLQLKDGHAYPVSARVVDVTGDRMLTQVSPGGTIVTAEAAALGPDSRVQIEFIKPFTLYEAPNYYKAGVGLWLKQRGSGADRMLEVSHVIAGRSAERAGIQVGDLLSAVDGVAASKLEFVDAMDRLYGPPDSNVTVRVQRGKAVVEGVMNLTRGVRFRASVGIEVDWSADGPGLLVSSVVAESPAAKNGVKAGDRLVRFGSLDAADIPKPRLKELLQKDLTKENAVTVQGPEGLERTLSLERSATKTPVPPPFKT